MFAAGFFSTGTLHIGRAWKRSEFSMRYLICCVQRIRWRLRCRADHSQCRQAQQERRIFESAESVGSICVVRRGFVIALSGVPDGAAEIFAGDGVWMGLALHQTFRSRADRDPDSCVRLHRNCMRCFFECGRSRSPGIHRAGCFRGKFRCDCDSHQRDFRILGRGMGMANRNPALRRG